MMAKPGRPRKALAQLVWLGEDKLHKDGIGPRETTWNDHTFPIGVPVNVSDPYMVKKARGNPFFEVIENG
jgi:hypothetical protein